LEIADCGPFALASIKAASMLVMAEYRGSPVCRTNFCCGRISMRREPWADGILRRQAQAWQCQVRKLVRWQWSSVRDLRLFGDVPLPQRKLMRTPDRRQTLVARAAPALVQKLN